MNNLTIGVNIKKLRDERQITQQQLAEAIGISYQAISKWECGVSMPDVSLLPTIAGYFDVLIDELFKPNMVAYRYKATRLLALYESDTDNLEAFQAADKEYRKILEAGECTEEDFGEYAYLNECYARHFLRVAEEYFLKAIDCGREQKSNEHYKNQRQYILFLSRLGRSAESIAHHTKILDGDPGNPMHFSALVAAYQCAGDLDNAKVTVERGLAVYPNDAILLVFAGDIYKALGENENAIHCWDKSFDIDGEAIDSRFSLAFLLTEQKRYVEARRVWEGIIAWQTERGFEVETEFAKTEIRKIDGNC